MAYASVVEKTNESGISLQRMYVANVDSSEEDALENILCYLRSQQPTSGIEASYTWETSDQIDPSFHQKAKSITFKQMEEVSFMELNRRREEFGEEVDPLTGYDFMEFNNGFVEMMKENGWKLTQYFRDGFNPNREWTFYKGPLNSPNVSDSRT